MLPQQANTPPGWYPQVKLQVADRLQAASQEMAHVNDVLGEQEGREEKKKVAAIAPLAAQQNAEDTTGLCFPSLSSLPRVGTGP